MANIKGLVSISAIIACYHINGDLCGDSCKGSDISTIEFENFKKLEGDDRNEVIEAIIKDKTFGISNTDTVKNECIVFKSTNITPPNGLFIFLFKENIYNAQTNERIKESIKQLDGKKIFLIVGAIAYDSYNNKLRKDILPANLYKISKVNENGNKYKFEETNPGSLGIQTTGTGMPGSGNLSGMGGFGGMTTGMSPTGGGFPSTSHPGTQSSSFGRPTTTNFNNLN